MAAKSISAAEFDAKFDAGEDIEEYLDLSTLRRPGLEKKRVNVDFTDHMVRRLDREAQARGVTRQALIKMWIADRLDQAA
jgi:predicted DNA binding CopG/RHH family protein